tara:strand:- start:438 stop:968 length:531 start_codon:yes stop_codon:yes gene_type:complete
MSEKIENPQFVTRSGVTVPMKVGAGQSPNQARNHGVIGSKWTNSITRMEVEIKPEKDFPGYKRIYRSYPTPDMRYMTVVFSQYTVTPNNGAIYNANGELVKQLSSPNPNRLDQIASIKWHSDANEENPIMVMDIFVKESTIFNEMESSPPRDRIEQYIFNVQTLTILPDSIGGYWL